MILRCSIEEDYSSAQLDALSCVRDQAPPVYPPGSDKVFVKHADSLRHLLKVDSPTWSHFHHIRCKEGAMESISERCRNLLDAEKDFYQLLYYFRFKSDDFRCDSLRPMFCAMFAHTGYNRFATYDWEDSTGAIGSS